MNHFTALAFVLALVTTSYLVTVDAQLGPAGEAWCASASTTASQACDTFGGSSSLCNELRESVRRCGGSLGEAAATAADTTGGRFGRRRSRLISVAGGEPDVFTSFKGWPSKISLMSTHTSPCNIESYKAKLLTGEGYFFDSGTAGGWCRTIPVKEVRKVRAAHAHAKKWSASGHATAKTYLPVVRSSCPPDYQNPYANGKLCSSNKALAKTGETPNRLDGNVGRCSIKIPSASHASHKCHKLNKWRRDHWGEKHKGSDAKYKCLGDRVNEYNSWCGTTDAKTKWKRTGPVPLYEPLSWCVLKEFVDEYREQLANLDTTLCGDAGASARCDNVDGKQASKGMLSSTQSGYFGNCAVNMNSCAVLNVEPHLRWSTDKGICKKEFPKCFKDANAMTKCCRDGIHPDGALMTYSNVLPKGVENTCYKWVSTLSDELSCDIRNHASVCTKATVKHVHKMGTSSAMFLLKRSRCDKITNRCFTYKVGKCMTLPTGGHCETTRGSPPSDCPYFKSVFNGTPKEMVDPTVSWINAALKAMEDDKGYKDCVGLDAELAKLQMTIY